MKKIRKSAEPAELTHFRTENPESHWDDFRDSGHYDILRNAVFGDQGQLCAFCEVKIPEQSVRERRVEHFHPKSDQSTPDHNWALDWSNMIGVCVGGETQKEHKLPANLSCDAHKNYLINKRRLAEDCEGFVLNPLRIINTPCLFQFDKRTGKLKPDPDACAQLADIDNRYDSLVELVEKTIEILNLNCPRLADSRKVLLFEYERLQKQARNKGARRQNLRTSIFLNLHTLKPAIFLSYPCNTTEATIVQDY